MKKILSLSLGITFVFYGAVLSGEGHIVLASKGMKILPDRDYAITRFPEILNGTILLLRRAHRGDEVLLSREDLAVIPAKKVFLAIRTKMMLDGKTLFSLPEESYRNLTEAGWVELDEVFKTTTAGREKWEWKLFSVKELSQEPRQVKGTKLYFISFSMPEVEKDQESEEATKISSCQVGAETDHTKVSPAEEPDTPEPKLPQPISLEDFEALQKKEHDVRTDQKLTNIQRRRWLEKYAMEGRSFRIAGKFKVRNVSISKGHYVIILDGKTKNVLRRHISAFTKDKAAEELNVGDQVKIIGTLAKYGDGYMNLIDVSILSVK